MISPVCLPDDGVQPLLGNDCLSSLRGLEFAAVPLGPTEDTDLGFRAKDIDRRGTL
jgi:hypothetical protein